MTNTPSPESLANLSYLEDITYSIWRSVRGAGRKSWFAFDAEREDYLYKLSNTND